ncbi:MAG: ATP-binding protein [Candidatus Hydrogenedentes bacterium]|nr:ATP-binding protein [Candidatus Hydrogenedentota bacterium]
MARKKVDVAADHISKLASATPIKAIEELIWNALDAGGDRVEVNLTLNELSAVSQVEIIDYGPGIPVEELDRAFGEVGNSMKVERRINGDQRAYHGREGKGRFKALALSPIAIWETTYRVNGECKMYSVRLTRDMPDYYEPEEPTVAPTSVTGTRVFLDGLDRGIHVLANDDTRQKLAETFASYLSKYPAVKLYWAKLPIDIEELVHRKKELELFGKESPYGPAKLLVLEWNFKVDSKRLHFCDEHGFSLYEISAGVQAPGIDYTAYVQAPIASAWAAEERFSVSDIDQEVKIFVDGVKDKLREYLRGRLAEEAVSIVEQWKSEEIYPYQDAPQDPIGRAEREVFDIVAVRINEQHSSFSKSDADSKKLTLALIKESLETNPTSLTKLFREVLHLSKEDQEAFAELLERAPLTNIIRAGKMVADRLDVIHAFEHILFDNDWKKTLLERTQLHRLLVHEIWLLGEEYVLGADDDGLRDLLQSHLSIMGREELAPDVEVKLIDGKDGIPDLMLYRRRKVDQNQFEHLVIELKRPRDPLGQEETSQIKKYAFTVARDGRFNTQNCRWQFWLLGNELDEFVREETSSNALPEGCIHDGNGVKIWVKRWADVLNDARARYDFFREQLQIEASQSKGLETLKVRYPHLFEGKGARKKKDMELSAAKIAQE